ncbi:tumor necrosis factor ligand superfamily member 15-like [Platichthys flesus]|uniref:tumor necrosis factor ligand superfamily member 15-like n=1 Tax=Platichthys flesus TaxID=8260 RepID=UPI002DBF68C5|nr:tumor necrosis factor ligand superfamily member 15-like [Platichthys flesus]
MEESVCCCGADTAVHYQTTFTQLVRLKKKSRQIMAPISVVVLLLLTSAAVALLLVFGLMKQPDSHSSGINLKQQQIIKVKNPSAMLTVGSNINGKCLKWESDLGIAHCHGGFNYDDGNLVVPRDGIYRVFLQITYQSLDLCLDDLRLSSNVFFLGDSYNDSVLLLSSFDTVSCSMKQWRKSIYTAGLFELEANDRLYVTSSNQNLIIEDENLVFFGAELLAQ